MRIQIVDGVLGNVEITEGQGDQDSISICEIQHSWRGRPSQERPESKSSVAYGTKLILKTRQAVLKGVEEIE